MSQWQIGITSSNSTLLPFLITQPSFNEATHTILEENGLYYLVSSDFATLTEYAEVTKHTDELLHHFNLVIKLLFDHPGNITKTGNASYLNDQGQKQHFTTRSVGIRASIALSIDNNFFQNKVQQHPHLMEKLLSSKDPIIKSILNYHAKETSWRNFYDIYEIIRNDTRKMQAASKVPPNAFDIWTQDETGRDREEDFTESANNYNLSGETARHSPASSFRVEQVNLTNKWHIFRKEKNSRQRDIDVIPMSQGEAKEFINKLLIKWIQAKI